MSLTPLLAGNFDHYRQLNADQPDLLWVFQHIPKTAGSSFAQELAARLAPAANVHADHADRTRPAAESLEESLQGFLQRLPEARYRFVSGHLRGPHLQRIVKASGRTRLITILREPVDRVVSDFRYMRTPAHPSYREVIERYPRFEDYLADPRSQNKMFRFLRRNPKASVEETIADLEQRFALVGTLGHYELCARLLFRLLGDERAPRVHTRKTESRPENEIANLDALRPAILAANPLDEAIYRHFQNRLDALRPALEAWLDQSART